MKRVLITGSNGIIGKIIVSQLNKDYKITEFDLPKHNACNYKDLLNSMKGQDVVIHLAWDTIKENWKSNDINPNNELMTFNIYKAALQAGVSRVIMASSVHADDYSEWKGSKLMKTNTIPVPDSPYGASKVFMEALGRYYAKKGLQVVCIRFMGLNPNNKSSEGDPEAKKKWFSHRDCGDLIKSIIESKKVPNNFSIIYGLSNNKGRIHDFSNPFGWKPKDRIR